VENGESCHPFSLFWELAMFKQWCVVFRPFSPPLSLMWASESFIVRSTLPKDRDWSQDSSVHLLTIGWTRYTWNHDVIISCSTRIPKVWVYEQIFSVPWMILHALLVFWYPFWNLFFVYRLIDIAPHYYDLSNFPQCEARRVLERLYLKREREKTEAKTGKR
jgi:hypothetical protein